MTTPSSPKSKGQKSKATKTQIRTFGEFTAKEKEGILKALSSLIGNHSAQKFQARLDMDLTLGIITLQLYAELSNLLAVYRSQKNSTSQK